ncbi:MAG: SUMF1/EgtB/PvdO family nonheme iron enzyme [Deltaproteobacteria bacterium]|nr:SUMF1/EgtB/PvdO family nonheme iron enzyme [Deltaproteobacteria bacterium]
MTGRGDEEGGAMIAGGTRRWSHGLALGLAAVATAGCYASWSDVGDADAGDDAGAARDDAAADRADDAGSSDVGDADVYCHSGTNPCPPGTVLVPCGPFVMGSDPGEGDLDEEPEHVLELSAFCIDAAEVTNGAYAACVTAGHCTPPGSSASATRPSYFGNPTYDGFAMVNVNWYQADTYCAWVGKRLPTQAEWEKAARGGCDLRTPASCGPEDEPTYPWGEAEPTCDRANFVGCVGDVDRAAARPAGAGPYDAPDLVGNVQEWVADWYLGTAYDACRLGGCVDPTGPAMGSEKVFRGGHWESVPGYLRAANRFRQDPGFFDYHTGFRCALSIRP